MKIVTVVGARPQFVKAAVLSRHIRSDRYKGKISELIVHTGQHYDRNMSEVFFSEMQIPHPDVNLGISGGSHGSMTGEMLAKIEEVLAEHKPDLVMVYGDTNSTLAGALAAAKLHISVAHVEAGLRSFNMIMPEEINRVLTDHIAEYLFCPSAVSVENLRKEGIPKHLTPEKKSKVFTCGDIMFDASLFYREINAQRKEEDKIIHRLNIGPDFVLTTVHRAENTDNPARLEAIFSAMNEMEETNFILPLHPRTGKIVKERGITINSNVRVIEPVGYFDMLDLEEHCRLIMTDSGGVQKEAYFFGKPCITLRDETEWVETVQSGWNRLVGAEKDTIKMALMKAVAPKTQESLYGDGDAGTYILESLLENND
ncbi:non-hydrolyzing UDP-N-acetylglucosamine 2-epimerase [Marispirochaeta sp.]|uniref:non-hydrolyzing UDP-N-acetylglucosamine 2-epimerase n=1 Tax=Marispirochaeta sp. TaxID=2038653 RepID=UPI0029C60298|nr:UDP-N-acetylglucosamine 2-epimerase (non-hydrolyzing) [Marispirochaeta sp.]